MIGNFYKLDGELLASNIDSELIDEKIVIYRDFEDYSIHFIEENNLEEYLYKTQDKTFKVVLFSVDFYSNKKLRYNWAILSEDNN